VTDFKRALIALALLLVALPVGAMHHRWCPPMGGYWNPYWYWWPQRAAPQPEAPAAETEIPVGDAAKGRVVFNAVCSACHLQGYAGAPRLGDKAAWSSRIDKGEAILLNHALWGYRLMPAKGTCGPCSAQDLADAIAYMVERSQ